MKRSPEEAAALLAEAFDRAIEAGDVAPLRDRFERGSGLPGPHPNLDFAAAAALELDARGGRGERLLEALAASEDAFDRIVAAYALASRAFGPGARRGYHDRLKDLAADVQVTVRVGVVGALRGAARARPDFVGEIAGFFDSYFAAHVVLEALADRTLLASLRDDVELRARLDEAFALADGAPRAASRTQGLRALRRGLPAQITVFSERFASILAWFEARLDADRPETREVLAETLRELRRASHGAAAVDRLSGRLEATAPPPRDPSRIRRGTRRRSKGRK